MTVTGPLCLGLRMSANCTPSHRLGHCGASAGLALCQARDSEGCRGPLRGAVAWVPAAPASSRQPMCRLSEMHFQEHHWLEMPGGPRKGNSGQGGPENSGSPFVPRPPGSLSARRPRAQDRANQEQTGNGPSASSPHQGVTDCRAGSAVWP